MRQFGSHKGQFSVGPEFSEPLPDDELAAWEGGMDAPIQIKYAGPIAVETADITALDNYSKEMGVMFCFWGMPGQQTFSVTAAGLAKLDPAAMPEAFRGVVWRDALQGTETSG